ncbi:MAG: RnfABCDGE type electron transport complex subunit B [Arenicellales bacterium]|jgi:electron transport complex protein RnfB|nr:RnfABCDGE type electron transport complex subunit B [Arenicellales bacterium]MDP6790295.1 RnfABCDGE type electron transport complex subunit B [Arenicellales bacterium]MDP6918231.1 RnfABCDGE type electron transport complex subunit B [Arenicellales bacterium]
MKASVSALDTVETVNAALPQLQCERCGYPSCRHYAEAVSEGDAPANRCDPGGIRVLGLLNGITGQDHAGLEPAFDTQDLPTAVMIRESECIGCTLCIKVCPVTAIVGAGKLMHTVILDDCTGCELCLPACPVDCIAAVGIASKDASEYQQLLASKSSRHRSNFERRERRLESSPLRRTKATNASRLAEIDKSVARVRLRRVQLQKGQQRDECDPTW